MATTELDLTGLKCPLPALRTRKALSRLSAGDRLQIRCTDPMAAIDIPHLVNDTGHHLVETRRNAAEICFLIEVMSI